MEKGGVIIPKAPPQRAFNTHTRFHISLLLGLGFLSWILYSRIASEETPDYRIGQTDINRGPPEPQEEFAWTKITPTRELEYTPCYGKFQCARLDVPMDHKSPSAEGSRVAVAVIRYPARAGVIDPRYGGVILLNPGGPGGSGINLALNWAETISKIVNPSRIRLNGSLWREDARFYDIVSFDPRGVNNTTPHIDCFPDNFSHDVFRLQMETEGFGYPEAKSKRWARAKALGLGCSEHGSEIIEHMNTAPVVADMVEIIERHGEWRSKQAKIWVDSPSWINSTADLPSDHLFARKPILDRTQYIKGEEKLQYWGFSYGTLLGATFAALEPQRVGKVIIDGVCDSKDYYETGWLSNLRDTDKIMEKFYAYCSRASTDKCPLNTGDLTPKEIQSVVEELVSSLKEDPIAVPGSSSRGADIITYSDVMSLIKEVFYKPIKLFPLQANLLADMAYGNGSLFADYKAQLHVPSCPLNNCDEGTQSCILPTDMAGPAIFCSDGELLEWSKKDWFHRIDTLVGQSKWMGEYWSSITMQCATWKARARWNVKPADITGNTSHPILLIGNTLDPVTPLHNAYVMQKRFPGSEVLTQDSEGHCSISSPSLCTVKAIRAYFQTGALPTAGTICSPEELPFLGKIERDLSALSEEDESLLEIMEEMKDLEGMRLF